MKETFDLFSPQTSPATGNATSSPASESGATPSGWLDGLMTETSGPEAVLASRSAKRARNADLPMNDIFTRSGVASSLSNVLAWSLANRLRQTTGTHGSTLYKLTWKLWATPSGRSFYLLRASGLPTNGTGSGSWPTPTSRDHKDVGNISNTPENGLLGRFYKNRTGRNLPPAFSAFLMGIPPVWEESAPTEMPSTRMPQRRSSAAISA